MTNRGLKLVWLAIPALLLLSACLGELTFPVGDEAPAPTRAAPPVDPTIAAVPRIRIDLAGQSQVSNQPIPQISHDLIGREDCLMCHKQGVSAAPRIPDSHRGLESNVCQSCHTALASAEMSGAEMYTRVCARCHGEKGEGIYGPALNTKAYLGSVSDAELRAAINRGRGTSEMLAWGDLGLLTERQIDELVMMFRAWEATAPETAGPSAVKPASAAQGDPENGEALFAQLCTGCHGFNGETVVGDGLVLHAVIEVLDDTTIAREIRDGRGEMPSFHALLTSDDINDLLALMRSWTVGPQPTTTPILLGGDEVFARVCARCHGLNGEGGSGPPLNSKEFLTANDDDTIRQWVIRGTLGTSMLSWGDLGLLSPDQIDQLVAFIRAWEPTAPSTAQEAATAPPASAAAGDTHHGQQLFAQFCSGCHGLEGERQTGDLVLNSEAFLNSVNDEILASQIQNGGRQMPAFHAVLTSQDVNDLLAYMRDGFSIAAPVAIPSFSADVFPILTAECAACHGTMGGWGAASYEEVMTSGQNAPVVLPGDPQGSLLVQKLLDTQTIGGLMPPAGKLLDEEIQIFIDWIAAGALDD